MYEAHDINPDTNLCTKCGLSRSDIVAGSLAEPCNPSEIVRVFDASVEFDHNNLTFTDDIEDPLIQSPLEASTELVVDLDTASPEMVATLLGTTAGEGETARQVAERMNLQIAEAGGPTGRNRCASCGDEIAFAQFIEYAEPGNDYDADTDVVTWRHTATGLTQCAGSESVATPAAR